MKLQLTKNTLISFVLKMLYVASLSVIVVELLTYPNSIKNYLYFDAAIISFLFFVAHAVLLFFNKKDIKTNPAFAYGNLFFLLPITVVVTTFAVALEDGRLFLNYFLEIFKLNYQALVIFAVPALSYGLLHLPTEVYKKHWKYLFLGAMLLLTVLSGMLYLQRPNQYAELVAEDGAVEYLSAILFLIAGIVSFLLRKKSRLFQKKSVQKIYSVGCIILAIALFLVAGEEISWGQRIFGIETPEHIAAQNHQGETNFHNSEAFWPFVYVGYTCIGIYGSLLWLLDWVTKDLYTRTKEFDIWRKILVPGSHLLLNFGFILLYLWLRKYHGYWRFELWEELTELLLVLGITSHLVYLYFSLRLPNLKN